MLQNSTRGFPIFADDAAALGTGLAGLSITTKLRKNGGSENTVSPTISDLGDGVYWIEPIAAHRDTLGVNIWKFTAMGAVIAPAFEDVVAVDNQSARFGAASQESVDELQTDVDGVLGYLSTLISRVTAGAAQLWIDLAQMVTGSNTADVQFTEKALEHAGGLTEGQAEQLTEIHTGLFPEDPNVSPVVITPSPVGTTTGWLVCLGTNASEPAGGVTVSIELIHAPRGEAGYLYSGSSHSAQSAENGVVQFAGLVPGASYRITAGSNSKNVTIPTSLQEPTIQLPSVVSG